MSKKRIVLHIFAAFLVLLYFLLARMPVSLLIEQIRKNAPFLTMGVASGSLWDGELSGLSINLPGGAIDLGRTQWKIQTWHLLLGELAFHLHAEKELQLIDADVQLGVGKTLSIHDGKFELPASNLARFYPIPGKIDGMLELTVSDLKLSAQNITRLEATGVFKNAAYTLNEPVALGTYGARFTLLKEKVKAELSDVDAQVGLTGYASFDPKLRDYEVDVKLSPKNTANPLIAQSLATFLQPEPDGSYHVNKAGHI